MLGVQGLVSMAWFQCQVVGGSMLGVGFGWLGMREGKGTHTHLKGGVIWCGINVVFNNHEGCVGGGHSSWCGFFK